MSAMQSSKFWSGFASGALSSIAASAWGGGSTTETNFETNSNLTEGHFVTTTYAHQGISGAIGANNVPTGARLSTTLALAYSECLFKLKDK